MNDAQQSRKKRAMQPSTEDARILDALKKASANAKRKAIFDGVPFIAGKRKTWSVP
jgi:hypothetical protein